MNDNTGPQFIDTATGLPLLAALDNLGAGTNMRRDRPYNGQAHTDTGERGKQLIEGITIRDIRDAFIRAFIISHPTYGRLQFTESERIQPNATLYDEALKGPDAALCSNDMYSLVGDFDPLAVAQNLTCEIERLMGIFPNIPGRTKGGYGHESVKEAS